MPLCHVAEDFMPLKEACPVTSVLLGITVHCSLLLYHSLVLLDFMQMKLPLPVVLSVIEDTDVQTQRNLQNNVLLVISVLKGDKQAVLSVHPDTIQKPLESLLARHVLLEAGVLSGIAHQCSVYLVSTPQRLQLSACHAQLERYVRILLFLLRHVRLGHTAMALTVYHVTLDTTVRLLQMFLSLALMALILMELGQSPVRPVMLDIHV